MLYNLNRRDSINHVTSVSGYLYPCPTIDTLDTHLTYLRMVARDSVSVEQRTECNLDIDRLLDRRLYLMLVG